MTRFDRRQFIARAAALGAVGAWAGHAHASAVAWTERRDVYAEGVASGDPDASSVILWTRRAGDGAAVPLTVEVAEDEGFRRVVATARTETTAAMGWTTRVLVGGLEPRRAYWYRFTGDDGAGSRIGRTITAPRPDDGRPFRFAFVSCQNANQGAQHAYRRMIYEDARAAPADQLGFVLHLGDFIYEIIWYPEDRPKGYFERRLRDVARYPTGRKVSDFHLPVTLDDYRAVYCGYLRDPDIQDARAQFPFVHIGDNHEFSWQGWQAMAGFAGRFEPGQALKVAANQAWFEHQPARVKKPGASLNTFDAPKVTNAPIERFDEHGLASDPDSIAALASLTAYRALRFGKHLDLILTDLRSYRSEDATNREGANAFVSRDHPNFFPEEVQIIADAGRMANGGKPPATIPFGDKAFDNFAKDAPPQTILGATQKAWFLDRLKTSRATWKVWGATTGILDWRADPQNIPAGLTQPWPGAGYATSGGGDHGAAYVERGEIYDLIRREKVTGFAAVSGDRHAFWAGRPSKVLPPGRFDPVGVAFITGSISSPGAAEGNEFTFPKAHPLRGLFLADRPNAKPEPTLNLMLRHGVRTALDYAEHRDLARAKTLRNPDNAPHLDFVDVGGHGYAVVTVSEAKLGCDFVCIPRPAERNTAPDGGPLRYRVRHEAALWPPGGQPKLVQTVLEGDPGLSI